jgi:aminocarboxymuconate-semialdehyde decarboxylase
MDPCSARIMVGGELFRKVSNQLYDVEKRLADMDATGVDRQVLSTVPVMFSYWAKARRTRDFGRFLNEHLAEVVDAHPDRFSAFGTVPMNDPDLAVEELERCVGELGMVGVQIGTNVAGVDLDDPRLLPFFTRASELGAIVFVHPWQVIGAERMRSYYFTYTVAMPSETAFAVGALLFGGVLDKLPDLQLVFAHGGGSTAYVIGRMERGWEVWEPARQHLTRPPSEALRCCYFDSVTWDAKSLELLVDRVGADRVLLGSDYPFIMGEDRPGTIVEESALAEHEKQAILGGNAGRLLGLGLKAGGLG